MEDNTTELAVEDDNFVMPTYSILQNSAILKKIVELMKEVGNIPKDRINEFHSYRYLSAAGILDRVQPALVRLGLVARQEMFISRSEWVETREGKKQHLVIVRCMLSIEDSETGQSIFVQSYGSGMDSNDKAIMKAQTAAHKYSWMHLLNIPTGDDPEADSSTDHATSAPATGSPSPLPPGEIQWIKTGVLGVKKKTANERSPYVISTPMGDFTTFNKDIATSAEVALGVGAEIEFEYKVEMYRGTAEKKILDPKKKGD